MKINLVSKSSDELPPCVIAGCDKKGRHRWYGPLGIANAYYVLCATHYYPLTEKGREVCVEDDRECDACYEDEDGSIHECAEHAS